MLESHGQVHYWSSLAAKARDPVSARFKEEDNDISGFQTQKITHTGTYIRKPKLRVNAVILL